MRAGHRWSVVAEHQNINQSRTSTTQLKHQNRNRKEADVYERGTGRGRDVYSTVLSRWLMIRGHGEIDGRNMESRSTLLMGERGVMWGIAAMTHPTAHTQSHRHTHTHFQFPF